MSAYPVPAAPVVRTRPAVTIPAEFPPLPEVVAEFMQAMLEKGGPQEQDWPLLDAWFDTLDGWIGKGYYQSEDLPQVWAAWPQVFLTTNTLQGFVISRPHGYAGDFELIDRIYRYWTSPDPALARWDAYAHARPACQSVRNRKRYFIETMRALYRERGELSILDVGSGPGRDVRELLEAEPEGIRVDCLDQDTRAIAHARKVIGELADHVDFIHANALRFVAGARYDVVWSAGLFDYLSDRLFVRLLSRMLKMARADGEVIVGNFSLNNPSRPYMEFGHWCLNHRSAETLTALAIRAGASPEQIRVEQEPEGINLFLRVRKG